MRTIRKDNLLGNTAPRQFYSCGELGDKNIKGEIDMKCAGCESEINNNDYCVCTKCRRTVCPNCAKRNSYVCSECGGDIAYLS